MSKGTLTAKIISEYSQGMYLKSYYALDGEAAGSLENLSRGGAETLHDLDLLILD